MNGSIGLLTCTDHILYSFFFCPYLCVTVAGEPTWQRAASRSLCTSSPSFHPKSKPRLIFLSFVSFWIHSKGREGKLGAFVGFDRVVAKGGRVGCPLPLAKGRASRVLDLLSLCPSI